MTGRERLNAILRKQPADRLSWTTLVDGATVDSLPENLRGNSGMDFYRHLGCDIFMLNGWNTSFGFNSPELQWGDQVKMVERREGAKQFNEWKTPRGTLEQTYEHGHPVTYPVKTPEDLRIYREMWEGARFFERDDQPSFAGVNGLIGHDGITTRFWGPSTIPRLLEYDVGMENFYYLLNDHPREMAELINLIHQRELQAFEILSRGSCETVVLCENTSTYYISPDVYRRFNGPHVKDFVDAMHVTGKIAIIHMCGHVLDLLPDIRKTGLDGVHALTPPPTGNTPWEKALDVLGEDCVIIGILDPSVFITGPLEEIAPHLDALYTPRLRKAHFVLWPAADGIKVPLERFEAVARWMEKNGKRKV